MVAQLSAYPRFRRVITSLWGGSALRLHPSGVSSDAHGPIRGDIDVSCHGPPSWPESSSFVGVWSRGFDCSVSDFVPTTLVGRQYPCADRVASPVFQS